MPAIAGKVTVLVHGAQVFAEGDVEVNIGRPKRTDVTATHGYVGFTEEAQPAVVKLKAIIMPDTDIDALLTATDAPVTVELSNGTSYVLPKADAFGDGTITNQRMDIEFHGAIAEVSQS